MEGMSLFHRILRCTLNRCFLCSNSPIENEPADAVGEASENDNEAARPPRQPPASQSVSKPEKKKSSKEKKASKPPLAVPTLSQMADYSIPSWAAKNKNFGFSSNEEADNQA